MAQALLTVFLALIIVFLAVRALPGDPAIVLAGDSPDPAVLEAVRARFGLDQPLWTQFWLYLRNAVAGDLGISSTSGQPVTSIIAQTLPVTLQVTLLSILIAAVVGMVLGVVAAYWRGQWPEWLANGTALIGLSVPSFWLAILAIVWLAGAWGFIPASGFVRFSVDPSAWFTHVIVPAVILGTTLAAIVTRQTRSSMLEVLDSDFILAARSRGMRESRVILRHGLRNSLLVVVTLIGLQAGVLISGMAVIEQIFGLPGVGRTVVTAVFARDYAVIQAVILVCAVLVVTINLIVDLVYGVLDPRVRVGGKS